jgi:hypothetical protein
MRYFRLDLLCFGVAAHKRSVEVEVIVLFGSCSDKSGDILEGLHGELKRKVLKGLRGNIDAGSREISRYARKRPLT